MDLRLYLILAAVALISTASAINCGISGDAGSTSTAFKAENEDSVSMSAVLSDNSLQNSISGSGSFTDNRSVKNMVGYEASVGVNITDAESYAYNYRLEPGNVNVTAHEGLDVENATFIMAYAMSKTPRGDTAGSKIWIERGSLKGYSNQAGASNISNTSLYSHQEFSKAEGDVVKVISWGHVNKYPERRNSVNKDTTVDTNVISGSLTVYSDLSIVKKKIDINEHKLNSMQACHIDLSPERGIFQSFTTSQGSNLITSVRTANYGTNYDLVAISKLNPRNDMEAKGYLTYYVDKGILRASSIQGAINAAQDNDTIKVAPGDYYEHLLIDRSLYIKGAGDNKTKIIGKGGLSNSLVSVYNPKAYVYLDGLALTKGNAEKGGGIFNLGNLILDKCNIYSNQAKQGGAIYNIGNIIIKSGMISSSSASENGGGIYNDKNGCLYLMGGNLESNKAKNGGGVCNNNEGILYLSGANVQKNNATNDGGGVYNGGIYVHLSGNILSNGANNGAGVYNNNGGIFYLANGSIKGNFATNDGGGVWNFGGAKMMGGNIVSNKASRGAGVYNKGNRINVGIFNISGGKISENSAVRDGGAIYNDHGRIGLHGGDISKNKAPSDGCSGIKSVAYRDIKRKPDIEGDFSIVHDNQYGKDITRTKNGLGIKAIMIIVGILMYYFFLLNIPAIPLYLATLATTCYGTFMWFEQDKALGIEH
jgi:hypothetical protein